MRIHAEKGVFAFHTALWDMFEQFCPRLKNRNMNDLTANEIGQAEVRQLSNRLLQAMREHN